MLREMGVSFVNYQIRSTDHQKVAASAAQLVQGRGYVAPPMNDWTSLYDEMSEEQDAHEIDRLGSTLSAILETAVFCFVIDNSSMFAYFLFENGDLLDEYNSTPPPTSVESGTDSSERLIGRPEILMNYVLPGVQRMDIESALVRGDSLVEGGFASLIQAEDRLLPLVKAMQMDELRATLGFSDIVQHYASIPDFDQFLRLDGKKFRRPVQRIVPPRIPPRG